MEVAVAVGVRVAFSIFALAIDTGCLAETAERGAVTKFDKLVTAFPRVYGERLNHVNKPINRINRRTTHGMDQLKVGLDLVINPPGGMECSTISRLARADSEFVFKRWIAQWTPLRACSLLGLISRARCK